MQKDIEDRMKSTLECGLCSKKIQESNIYSTFTPKKTVEDFKFEATVPFCSYECDLAFKLRQALRERKEIDVKARVINLEISENWSKKDIKIAIGKLLFHEEYPIKEALIEYLVYAGEYGLLSE